MTSQQGFNVLSYWYCLIQYTDNEFIPINQNLTLSLKKSNDIVIPSPLDTNMLASSGYRRMGGWGKRDELMNGYKRLHSYYLNLVIK